MSKVNYKEYINSKEWKKKKQEVFNERGKECEQCGAQHYIHVHHLNYDNLGNENLEDLQILCYRCHMSKHDEYFNKFVLKKKPVLEKKKKKRKSKKRIKDKKHYGLIKHKEYKKILNSDKAKKQIAKTKEQKALQLELCDKLRKKGIVSVGGKELYKLPLNTLKSLLTVKG